MPKPAIRHLEGQHPRRCSRCADRLIIRSGLAGYRGDAVLCSQCLKREEPSLGWALTLIEQAAAAIGGRWPTSAHRDELAPILEILSKASSVFGPLLPSNNRLGTALDLVDHLTRPAPDSRSTSGKEVSP